MFSNIINLLISTLDSIYGKVIQSQCKQILVLSLLITIISCKNSALAPEVEEINTYNPQDVIYTAKSWYESQTSSGRISTDSENQQFPVWASSKTIQISKGNKLVITPLWIKSHKKFRFASIDYMRRLVTTLDKSNNVTSSNIVEVVLDKNSWRNNKEEILIANCIDQKKSNRFSGHVLFSNLAGKLVYGYFIKNGETISKNIKLSGVANGRKSSCYETYLITFYSDGSSTYDLIGAYCTDDGGSPSQLYAMLPPDVHEGTKDPVNNKIDNDVTDPCLKQTVDNVLLNMNISNIAYKMNEVFGNNDQYNVRFINGTLPRGDEGDRIIERMGFDSNHAIEYYDALITLNSSISSYSKEYQTAVIYHESIHAYIDAKYDRREVYNQHTYMAENFVNWMSGSIQSAFPNISTRQANALALNGLQDHPKFATEIIQKYGFNSIGELSSEYQPFQGKTSNRVGTYCN